MDNMSPGAMLKANNINIPKEEINSGSEARRGAVRSGAGVRAEEARCPKPMERLMSVSLAALLLTGCAQNPFANNMADNHSGQRSSV
jgi:hypothetical protein